MSRSLKSQCNHILFPICINSIASKQKLLPTEKIALLCCLKKKTWLDVASLPWFWIVFMSSVTLLHRSFLQNHHSYSQLNNSEDCTYIKTAFQIFFIYSNQVSQQQKGLLLSHFSSIPQRLLHSTPWSIGNIGTLKCSQHLPPVNKKILQLVTLSTQQIKISIFFVPSANPKFPTNVTRSICSANYLHTSQKSKQKVKPLAPKLMNE